MSDSSEVLNRITAPDSYTPTATIEDTPIQRVNLDVSNQGIYWQLKKAAASGPTGYWETVETFMAPGSRTLHRPKIVGIRIRAATPVASLPAGTSQSVVTVEAIK